MSQAINEGFPAQPGEAPVDEKPIEVTPDIEIKSEAKSKPSKSHKSDHK